MEWRFERASGLRKKAVRLSADELAALHQRVRPFARTDKSPSWDIAIDITNMDPDAVRDCLRGLPLRQDARVLVGWWDQPEIGLATDLATFIEYYDDIWYPSSDNLFVVPATLDWLIDLDHEEQLSYRRIG